MSEQFKEQKKSSKSDKDFNAALDLMSQQKFNDAKEILISLLPEANQNQKEIFRYYLMSIALAEFDYDQALEYCDLILDSEQINQYTLAALFYVPYCKKQLGDNERAVILFNRALDFFAKQSNLNPTDMTMSMYMVLCLYELKQYGLALNIINMLLKFNTDNPEYIMLKSSIEKALGDEKGAKLDKETAVKDGGFIANIINIAENKNT